MDDSKQSDGGLYIPGFILNNLDLDVYERYIVSYIYWFTQHGKGCFQTRSAIARRLGISRITTTKRIDSLIRRGYLKSERNNGRTYYMTEDICKEGETVLTEHPKKTKTVLTEHPKYQNRSDRTPQEDKKRSDRTPQEDKKRSDRTPNRSDRTPNRSDRTPNRSDRTPIYRNREYISNKQDKNSISQKPEPSNIPSEIEDVFDGWNSFRGVGRWKGHTRISDKIQSSIREVLKAGYSVEEILDSICNYADVLLNPSSWWTHAWTLSEFLKVRNRKVDGSPWKWLKFHPDNFNKTEYFNGSVGEIIWEDEYPEVKQAIITRYGRVIGNKTYSPRGDIDDMKFRKAAKRFVEFYKTHDIPEGDHLRTFFGCLKETYLNKDEPLYPGHLCSDHTWDVLMPQYVISIYGDTRVSS